MKIVYEPDGGVEHLARRDDSLLGWVEEIQPVGVVLQAKLDLFLLRQKLVDIPIAHLYIISCPAQ